MWAAGEAGGRHEVKLALDPLGFERVRAELALHASAVRRQHPERIVQSLYFERAGERVDPLEGSDERAKLRLRWYGDACLAVRARLEEKSRRGELGFKRADELDGPFDVEHAMSRELLARLRALAPARWRAHLARDIRPSHWTAYRREYLVTADGRVRVTIDRDLRAFDQRFLARVERGAATPLPNVTIVELKARPDARDELRELCCSLSARPERCSKLALASDPRFLHAVTDLF